MVKLPQNVDEILEILRKRYPSVKTWLEYDTPFQLLVATILSAQCTDAQVNKVTKKLFLHFPNADSLAKAHPEEVEHLVFSTGFYRNKARNIRHCARAILKNHQDKVPDNLTQLTALPGVGRKTANLILSVIYNHQTIVVDTHVTRVSQKLGLTSKKTPVSIEFALMKILPEPTWNDFSLWMISLGREFCRARTPLCEECPLSSLCLNRLSASSTTF